MSKKEGTKVGVGRPTAGGESIWWQIMHDVITRVGIQLDLLPYIYKLSTASSLAHICKAAVTIKSTCSSNGRNTGLAVSSCIAAVGLGSWLVSIGQSSQVWYVHYLIQYVRLWFSVYQTEYRNNHHLHDTMPVRIHPKNVSHMFEYRRHVYKFYPTCVPYAYMYVCDNHYLICPKQQYIHVGSPISPYGSTTHSLIIKKSHCAKYIIQNMHCVF